MENSTDTKISISGNDLKSLAAAAQEMTSAAKSIADSVSGIKESVDSMGDSMDDLADAIDESMDGDDYDARIRAEAERMQAEATGKNGKTGNDEPDRIMEAIAELKESVAELAEMQKAASDRDKATSDAIMGDTVSGSASEIGAGVLTRMDSAIELFSDIRSQMGSLQTWIDTAAQQIHSAITDLKNSDDDDIQQEDIAVSDEPAPDYQAMIESITEQYSELAGSLNAIGEKLDGLKVPAVPDKTDFHAETQEIPVKVEISNTEELESNEDGDADGSVPPVLDYSTQLEQLSESVVSAGDTISSGIETVVGNASQKLDTISESLGNIYGRIQEADTANVSISDNASEAEPRASVQENDADTVVSTAVERIIESKELIRPEDVTASADANEPAGTFENDSYHEDFGKTLEAITGIQHSLSDFFDRNISETESAENKYPDETVRNGNDTYNGIQPASDEPEGDSSMQNSVKAIDIPGLAELAESIKRIGESQSFADYTALRPSEIVGSDYSTGPMDDAKQAPSTPDRYGSVTPEDRADRQSIGREPVIDDYDNTVDTRHTNANDGVRNYGKVTVSVPPLRLDNQDYDRISTATRDGMVSALLDDRFRQLIESSVSDIVRRTVKSIVG